MCHTMKLTFTHLCPPYTHKLIRLFLYDKESIEFDLTHMHFAVSDKRLILFVDECNVEISGIFLLVEEVLAGVAHALEVLLACLLLVVAHHVGRDQVVPLEELPETLPLDLLGLDLIYVLISRVKGRFDDSPFDLVGHYDHVLVCLLNEAVVLVKPRGRRVFTDDKPQITHHVCYLLMYLVFL